MNKLNNYLWVLYFSSFIFAVRKTFENQNLSKTKEPMKSPKFFLTGLILLFLCGLDVMEQQIHVKDTVISKCDNGPVISSSILEVLIY